MAFFVYSGSVSGHPIEWHVVGKIFPAGQAVEVDELAARKLRCLNFFQEVTEEPTVDADLTAIATGEKAAEEPLKRKRGRPPGAKNRPKVNDGDSVDAYEGAAG